LRDLKSWRILSPRKGAIGSQTDRSGQSVALGRAIVRIVVARASGRFCELANSKSNTATLIDFNRERLTQWRFINVYYYLPGVCRSYFYNRGILLLRDVFSLSIISDTRNARRMNHALGRLEDFYAGLRPGLEFSRPSDIRARANPLISAPKTIISANLSCFKYRHNHCPLGRVHGMTFLFTFHLSVDV